ncbi:hypothetical protein C8A05DRAFT_35987, partial [Staphylotrichum tortipilum]
MPPPAGAAAGDSASCSPTSCSPSTPFSTLLSLTPLLLTFALASSLALTHLFPRLAHLQQPSPSSSSGGIAIDDGNDHLLPASAPESLRQAHAEQAARSPRARLAAAAFATTVGLAAVVGVLIVAE